MSAHPAAGGLVHVLSYGPQDVEELALPRLVDARAFRGRRAVTWVNVDSNRDPQVLRSLEEDFGIHPLTAEDVRNARQRSKVEEYPGYVYVVTQMLRRDEFGDLETEQLSILLGNDWVITIQEKAGDLFDGVRDRIRQRRPRMCGAGPDYLVYALLDAIVDEYFPILEGIGAYADDLEDEALEGRGDKEVKAKLASLRRDLLTLRRVAWPQRDALAALERGEIALVRPETRTYLRDVSDHATRVIDFVETNRELATGLMDLYLAGVAHRTNDVTKVLTIVATIFIPLTFIAGVYGMNFDPDASPYNMPELEWAYGYPAALALMLATALGMLAFFRRKGWI